MIVTLQVPQTDLEGERLATRPSQVGHGPFEQLLFKLCPSAWVSDRPVPSFDWPMSNC